MSALRVEGVANGGEGIARSEGKVIFISGGIPGDLVEVEITEDRRSFERGRVVRILEASDARVDPPCRHASVCGGCDWQHADPAAQRAWKRTIVSDLLARVGKVEVEVEPTIAPGPDLGYRNRMDFVVADDGRLALHGRGSHDRVGLDLCLLLHPLLVPAFEGLRGRAAGLERVTLRAGTATGETMVLEDGETDSSPGNPEIHEVVAGVRFRITGRAFFQVNTAGAAALVETVAAMAALGPEDRLLDAYAGGGLFSATVGREARSVEAVESDPAACADFRHNVGEGALLRESRVEEALSASGHWDVAVLDPPRAGMGTDVTDGLAASAVSRVVSVSCDPATFARDAGRLVAGGFRLERVVPLDMFPMTHHIETVALFVR
jgi:23S rRNA (uracil1939-C5)-methyltransferase